MGSEMCIRVRFGCEISIASPDAWNGIVRAHLQNALESLRHSPKSTPDVAGRFTGKVYGSIKQRQMLRNALSEKAVRTLDDLMDVFGSISAGRNVNSKTVPYGKITDDIQEESLGTAGKAVNTITQPMTSVRNWVNDVALGKHTDKLVEILTDPESLHKAQQYAKAIKHLTPREEGWLRGISRLMAQLGGSHGAPVQQHRALSETVR